MLEGVVFANFQSLTFDGFVKKYSRERFHQRRLVSVEPSEDGTIGKTESICNEISSPDCRHGSNRVNDTHSVNNNSDTPDA